jgi:hypothetical protein
MRHYLKCCFHWFNVRAPPWKNRCRLWRSGLPTVSWGSHRHELCSFVSGLLMIQNLFKSHTREGKFPGCSIQYVYHQHLMHFQSYVDLIYRYTTFAPTSNEHLNFMINRMISISPTHYLLDLELWLMVGVTGYSSLALDPPMVYPGLFTWSRTMAHGGCDRLLLLGTWPTYGISRAVYLI